MVDEKIPISVPIKERLAFPEISVFDKLVKVAHTLTFVEKIDYGFSGSFEFNMSMREADLDRIYKFWHGMDEFVSKVIRISKSLDLRGIPSAEKKQAKEYLKKLVEVTEKISKSMCEFDKKDINKCSWKRDGELIHDAINDYDYDQNMRFYGDSIIALFEAISEVTLEKQLTEDEIRQKIAQCAIEELWLNYDYARLNSAADIDEKRSTIDEIEKEKDEFLAALRGNLWTDEEVKIQKIKIGGLKILNEEDLGDDELSDNIKLVWNTAIGKAKKSTTAIDVFIATEEIFDRLNSGGALDWDPDEEFEDDESNNIEK